MIIGAVITLPANAQAPASASLTHTVAVTIPSRVKIQVASLTVATPASINVSAGQLSTERLALTVNATQAWVLAVGSSSDVATRKTGVEWSRDARSQFSAVTTNHVPVATGARSFNANAANVFFRNTNGNRDGESVVLTVSAP